MDNKIVLTLEGKLAYERRRDELNNILLPQIVERIKVAKEQGDLSENAEYTAARDEQARLNGELLEIESILKYAEIITVVNSDVIQVGSKVSYKDLETNEVYSFSIVGTAEADLENGKISNEAPIGKALYGHKVGEVVTVIKPKGGKYEIEIISVE